MWRNTPSTPAGWKPDGRTLQAQLAAHTDAALPADMATAATAASPAGPSPQAGEPPLPAGQIGLRAPMAGKLVQFKAQPGDTLATGAEALVLEAMKMQHGIATPSAGQVLQLCVAAGDFVAEGQLLMTLAAGGPDRHRNG